jgi:hypothetical protein
MTNTMGRILLAACIVAASTTASAEVRLEARTGTDPSVEVITTPQGPWSPTTAVTSIVLNPDGDLIGDSQPGWRSRIGAAVAAWVRPTSSTIEIAMGRADHWTTLRDVPAHDAFRQPVVDALAIAWTVTWQQQDPSGPNIYMSAVYDSGQVADPVFVTDGILIATVPGFDSLHVLSFRPKTREIVWTEVHLLYVPTQPIPIELRPGGDIHVGDTRSPSLRDGCSDCAGLLVQPITLNGTKTTVMSWWTAPNTVNVVELSPSGPQFPIVSLSSRSSDPHPPRLLQDAIRAAVRR